MSQSSVRIEDKLIDPRSTRLSRLQAARRFEDQETLKILSNEGILNTVPPVRDEQGILYSGGIDQPVSSRIQSIFFPHSLSVSPPDILESQSGGNVQNKLETGDCDDALYISSVKDVACTISKCNKRISVARQEWSAGRQGNRSIGAREAARNTQTYLGPYATHETIQPRTSHNTHVPRQASSGLP